MPSNLREFTAQVNRNTRDLTDGELVLFHKKVVLDAWSRIVEKTPVDHGHARLNWQVTIGIPASAVIGEPGIAAAPPNLAAALSALAALGPFQVVYISNPVPYIHVLEEGLFDPPNPGPSSDPRPGRLGRILVRSGFSTQAPQGMVAVTVQELLAIFP